MENKVIKHGMSKTRIHNIWHSMYCRCYYGSTNGYERYGGRGIKVCDEWKHQQGFINFYNWAVKNGYKENLTLDRIDNNGNYCPENCRWVSLKEQGNNRRNNKIIEYKGIKKTAKQWCDEYNISQTTFNDRLDRGWTVEQALTVSTKGVHNKVLSTLKSRESNPNTMFYKGGK